MPGLKVQKLEVRRIHQQEQTTQKPKVQVNDMMKTFGFSQIQGKICLFVAAAQLKHLFQDKWT